VSTARTRWIVCVSCLLLLSGCASLPTLPRLPPFGDVVASDGPVVRPEAPAEYDLMVAQLLTSEGRSAEALEAFLRAVEKDPDSAFLQQRAAESLAQNNRLEEALVHAEAALALDAEDETTRVFAGQLYRMRKQTGDAERVLMVQPGEPISLNAAFLLYQIYLEAGRPDDALQTAQWMVAASPDSPRGRIAIANVYNRLGRSEDAELALREALATDPSNLHLYTALARMLHTRGAYVEEIALHRAALERYPKRHATLTALGEAQLELDDPDAAMATFMTIEERYPSDLDARLRLGFLFFEAHRYLEARQRFEHVLSRRSHNYEVAFFLGVVDRRIGDVDAAIEAFGLIPADHRYYADVALAEVEKSLAVRETREMRLYAATLRAKAGDLDGAVGAVEELLAEAPEDDELLFNLGVVYGEADRRDEAVAYMRRALEVNPENASALNYIGYIFAEQGVNLDEAETLITRAIALRPDDGYIVDSLGWVYYMRARPLVESGRAAEARKFLRRAEAELARAHELTGGDPVISEHQGDLYLLLDDKVRALEKFEEAIRLEPRQGEQPLLVEKFEMLRQELR
jgi:tetratricopeptide (TPR) repeat protein